MNSLLMMTPITLFTVSFVIWLFSEGYVIFKKTNQDGAVQNKLSDRILDVGTFLLIFLAYLFIWINKEGSTFGYLAYSSLRIFGFLTLILGIIFRQYSIFMLGKFFSGYIRVRNDHQLIKSGPYKIFRHPSYFGSFLCYIGLGFITSNIVTVVLFPISIFFMYIYRLKIEESVLIDTFGEEYLNYKKRTWGFLPFVK